MKKRFLLLLILPLFVNSIFADEYNNLYDLIVPESFSSLTIDGGLGNVGGNSSQLNYNDNILEMTIANGSFSLDVQADASYRLYNQTETTQLDIQTTGRVWVGPIQSGLFASLNADYTSYDLDIGGLSGFWYAGGYSNINANTTFLTLNVSPKAAIGVGRVYTIYDVYRAKLMLEHLGVTPTPEKVEAVVAVFQKSNEILNQYKVKQVDNVKPGMEIPGGIYFNLYVSRKILKKFLSRVSIVEESTILESKTVFGGPEGTNKVFIWIKQI
jgi:hypothetical protein